MKKNIFTLVSLVLILMSCTKDGETKLQPYNKIIFSETFTDANDGDILNTVNWTNFNEIGNKKWTEQKYQDNGYAEFSSFGSGQLVNTAWLVSPKIDMDLQEGEKMNFQVAQNFLRSRENVLEVLVSINYDGSNVAAADWIVVPAITPSPETERYKFISSGLIDLSKFKGKLNFAFRVKGSGTNSNLTGTYQLDNISVFYTIKE